MNIREIFEQFINRKRALGRSELTIVFYAQTVGDYVTWLEQNRRRELRTSYIYDFLAALQDNWHPPDRLSRYRQARTQHTIYKYAAGIRAFMRFASDEGHISPDKFDMPKRPTLRKPALNKTEVKKLLGACKTDRNQLIVRLLVDTGMRAAEALSLEEEDLHLDDGWLLVRDGKGSKDRVVPLSKPTIKLLRSMSNGGGAVLRTYKNAPLRYGGLRRALGQIEKATGITCGAHTLRRTCGTIAHNNGLPMRLIQRQYGHSSITTTEAYIQPSDLDLLKAHAEHGPFSDPE